MKKKILVVEDEESLRLLYEEELKAEGYEVFTAGNGREAIRTVGDGKTRFDHSRHCHAGDGWDGGPGPDCRQGEEDPHHPQHLLFRVSAGFYELGSRCLCRRSPLTSPN